MRVLQNYFFNKKYLISRYRVRENRMNKTEIKVDVSIEGIDEAKKKAERYVEVLKEAKTLAGELASMHFEIW